MVVQTVTPSPPVEPCIKKVTLTEHLPKPAKAQQRESFISSSIREEAHTIKYTSWMFGLISRTTHGLFRSKWHRADGKADLQTPRAVPTNDHHHSYNNMSPRHRSRKYLNPFLHNTKWVELLYKREQDADALDTNEKTSFVGQTDSFRSSTRRLKINQVRPEVAPNAAVNKLIGTSFADHFVWRLFPDKRKHVHWNTEPVAILSDRTKSTDKLKIQNLK